MKEEDAHENREETEANSGDFLVNDVVRGFNNANRIVVNGISDHIAWSPIDNYI
jgi:hypothetical protein